MPHAGPAVDSGFHAILFYNIRRPAMESYDYETQQNEAGLRGPVHLHVTSSSLEMQKVPRTERLC